MKAYILCFMILLSAVCGGFSQVTLPGKFNPHGKDQCFYCHQKGVKESKETFIQGACESCHNRETIRKRIHPLIILGFPELKVEIPDSFPIADDGRLLCRTCHKITCNVDLANRNFLRGGPYESELDFCFVCHDYRAYAPVNPHLQILADGKVDSSKCLNCHVKLPKPEDHPIISHKMHLEMSATCNKCHALHHHEEEHYGRDLARSKKASLERFRETERKYQITIPLKDDHIIQCNTCHYTHQRGLLKKKQAYYESKKENRYYLRIPRARLCYSCHNI